MSITQKELAERVGVSQALVASALNGRGRVGEATRNKVIEEAARLGYNSFSNHNARSLVARRHGTRTLSGLIGVLFYAPDAPEDDLRGEPYFTPFFQGIEKEAKARGLEVALCPARGHEMPRLLSGGGFDGIINIFSPASVDLAKLSLPIISLNQNSSSFHTIEPNERDGMRQAVEYLHSLGHRSIAYVGQSPSFWAGTERLMGYRATKAELGLSGDEALEEKTLWQVSRQAGADGMARLLSRTKDFTALVCYNDTIAMGAVRELNAQGLRVPEDVSVVGYDDISVQHGFSPALTSIRVPNLEIGRRAVQMLYELLERDDLDVVKVEGATRRQLCHEVFSTQLVVRESTQAFSR